MSIIKKHKKYRVLKVILGIVLVFGIVIGSSGLNLNKVNVSGQKSYIGLSSQVALAAALDGKTGNGNSISGDNKSSSSSSVNVVVDPSDGSHPVTRSGGMPITGISYNNDDIFVTCNNYPNFSFTNVAGMTMKEYAKNHTVQEIEIYATTLLQKHFEIWIDINKFAEDDPVRNGKFAIGEGVKKDKDNKENLVSTVGYCAVHVYSLNPLKYITKFNNLDLGPIQGVWW